MAYVSQGFKQITGSLSGTGAFNIWLLDTTDAIATVNTSNYVSDGYAKGARQGDVVYVRTRTALNTASVTAVHLCWVIDEATGTDGLGVDLTDGLAVTATDTD